MSTNLAIPTQVAQPRCFFLSPVISESQAYTMAGEHKGKVFNFDIRHLFKRQSHLIDTKLVELRFVPFWNVRCKSHFDYSRMEDYAISAKDPDAVRITIKGKDGAGNHVEIPYSVDPTGRSKGLVKISGEERCITNRDITEWIDSYMQTDDWSQKDLDKHQKLLREMSKQLPTPIPNLVEFGEMLTIDGTKIAADHVKTIVVPPLETADNVVRRTLKKVMVSIKAAEIYDWGLEVTNIDLYFRPLYVFQFTRLDDHGDPIELRQKELDALNIDNWITLQVTEYQTSNIPWGKILKLSADIGAIMLKEVPFIGTSLKIASTVADQAPGIIDDMKQ